MRQQSQCVQNPQTFVLEKLVWNLNISRQSLGMTMQHMLRDWMAGWQIQTSDQQLVTHTEVNWSSIITAVGGRADGHCGKDFHPLQS